MFLHFVIWISGPWQWFWTKIKFNIENFHNLCFSYSLCNISSTVPLLWTSLLDIVTQEELRCPKIAFTLYFNLQHTCHWTQTMQGDLICHIWSWPCFESHSCHCSQTISCPGPKHCQLQTSDLDLIFRCRINQTLSDPNWGVYPGFCVNSVWTAEAGRQSRDKTLLMLIQLPFQNNFSSAPHPFLLVFKAVVLAFEGSTSNGFSFTSKSAALKNTSSP